MEESLSTMTALATWLNKPKPKPKLEFVMSDAEVKKINILFYARVSTDLKLTEPFDTEIYQIPPI